MQSQQSGLDTELSEISYLTDISYEEFVEGFLSKNIPCLLSETHTRSWKCRQEWICNGKPCYEFLESYFGEAIVPVADCNTVQFQAHPKETMLFKEFINYWKSCNNDVKSSQKVCWYLKDWHFCKSFPDYKAYETPPFFQSDWLNEFWDKWSDMKDDYRFVYMGPKGTWTPFHADVFRSYSWSANICGHKKWILYPPGAEEYLKDTNGNLVFDLTSPEIQDRKKFPGFDKAPKPLVVEQKEGEIIFVPSCWHHQVINEEDTISINHNWINGSGVSKSWNHLKDELQLVKNSIRDCTNMSGWANQCQVILAAHSGINFQGFFKFLCSISGSRIIFLKTLLAKSLNIEDEPMFILESFCTNPEKQTLTAKENKFNTVELCLFDLQQIKDILEDFSLNGDIDELLRQQTQSLYAYLSKIIDDSH